MFNHNMWAGVASAARESVYFHRSTKSINTEAWVWGCPFSCQVCGVLKAAPSLCCSPTTEGIPFHLARIHPISCQQGPLSWETNWKRKEKKKKWRKSPWLEVDRRTSCSRQDKEEEEKKLGLCCKSKSPGSVLKLVLARYPSDKIFICTFKITTYHLSQPWITAIDGSWFSKNCKESLPGLNCKYEWLWRSSC